MSKDVAVVDDT